MIASRPGQLASGLTLAAACLALAIGAGTADEQPGPTKTTQEHAVKPSTDRPAPPVVPPVELNGVRYGQVEAGEPGILRASSVATGQTLWEMPVYVLPEPTANVEAAEVYFASMSPGPGENMLTIVNEAGHRYEVDLVQRTSKLVWSPPPAPAFEVPD